MIIINLFAGITIPANIDKAKIDDVDNVITGPHYPTHLLQNIIPVDSSTEYTMWTQQQECLAYNPLLGYIQFVCRNFAVGNNLDVWQSDNIFSIFVSDENVCSVGARYPNSIASDDGSGNGPHISFPYLITGAWGGMGAQYESGGWFSSFWDDPVGVGPGNVNTHKNIGKQLPNGNILFIGVTGTYDLLYRVWTPALDSFIGGGTLATGPSYYWGFDINAGTAYVFYYDDNLNVYYKTSTDGINWSGQQTYNMVWPQPFTNNVLYWCQMAVTDAGNPILVFDFINGDDADYPYEGKVYVSIASGQPCIEVGDTTSGAENFYPTVATGGNYVVVLFGETRSGSGQYTLWDVYYNYSADNGATWHTPINLTSGITDHNNCLWQIAKRVDPAGNGQFFFVFGCAISDPLLDLWWNVNWGNPILSRWYVGRNPIVGIAENKTETPKKLTLNIVPNPSQNHLVIKFETNHNPPRSVADQLPNSKLKIYDATGRLVKQFNHLTNYQSNYVLWYGDDDSGRPLPAGVYFVKLESEGLKQVEKVILLR